MTESTAPFNRPDVPQGYVLGSSLTYQWDVGTLEWVKGTQPGGGAGGAVTIADGADVAQGAKADAAWVSGDGTVISLLKKIASAGGSAVSIADGADVAQGAKADVAWVSGDGTVIAILKKIVSVLASPFQAGGSIGNTAFGVNNAAGASAVNIQDGGNSITVDGTLTVNTGLTDVQLRATPVPVSGTVTATTGGLTDTQLRNSPVAVSLDSFNIPGLPVLGADFTPSSPTAASVGVASAQAVAANANRRNLVLINTSNATISLGFGSAAVLNSGITLYPGGVFEMGLTCLDLGAVNAIASAAASNLAIQEYTV